MISYRYCHENGFDPECKDERVKSICEGLRTDFNGSEFRLYAVVNDNDGVFLDFRKVVGNHDFVQGLYVGVEDEKFTEAPSYYNNLTYTNATNFAEASFPTKKASIMPAKTDILGKLVDAIAFGEKDKTIAVIVKDEKVADSYLWHISEALPKEYMKRVGYCISNKYVKLNGEAKVKISFITGEMDESRYCSTWNEAYVFDTVKGRDNYEKELEDVSRAIEKLYNKNSLTKDVNKKLLSAIFNKSGYDEESGRIFATKTLCDSINSIDVSFKFLDLYVESPDNLKSSLVDEVNKALDYITKNSYELNKEQVKKLLAFEQSCPNFKDKVESAYFSYAQENMGKIGDGEGRCIEYILKDESGNTFNSFVDAVSIFEDFEKYHQAFKIIANVVVVANKEWDSDARCNALAKAIKFCDINIMHTEVARDSRQNGNGEDVFNYASIFENEDDANLIYAILMISAYRKDVDGAKKALRLKGLMNSITKQQGKAKDIIKRIISIRETMAKAETGDDKSLDVSHNLGSFMLDDSSSLSHAEDWINGTINELSIVDLVEIDSKLGEEPPYIGMIEKVTKRLENEKFFKSQMTTVNDENIVNQIEAIYGKRWAVESNRTDELKKIVSFLDNRRQERLSNEEFKKFRVDFVSDWVKTFSQDDKKTYLDGKDFATAVKEEKSPKDTTRIVEYIDNGYSRIERITQKKKKVKLVPLRTLLFAVIAAVIMVIPPVVQSLILKGASLEPMLEALKSYFEMIYIVVPVGVALIHLLVYNVASKENLKRANRAAVVCGILPVTFFAISFLAFWFLNVDIIAMFN